MYSSSRAVEMPNSNSLQVSMPGISHCTLRVAVLSSSKLSLPASRMPIDVSVTK